MILENKSITEKPGILRINHLKTLTSIISSAKHTWRENDASEYPHVALEKTHKNLDLIGATNSAELEELLNDRLAKAKYINKRSTLCLEFLITADFDAFSENGGTVVTDKLVKDAQQLLTEIFGIENIIGFNVQLDEMTPHIAAYVVPITYKPEKTTVNLKKDGTYADGSPRYRSERKTINAYTSLSATSFYSEFGGKSGMQDLFHDFVFGKNGLRRGFHFSRQKHIDAKTHRLALKVGYSQAMSELEFTYKEVKSLPNLTFKTTQKICEILNSAVLEKSKSIIAMATEYKNEKSKNYSLNETLIATQKRMKQIEEKNKNLESRLKDFDTLSDDHRRNVENHIARLKHKEETIAKELLDSKEEERRRQIEKIKNITINEFILLDDNSRLKIWRFSLENYELEEKFEELFSSDFFNPEDGGLNEKGISHKNLLNKEESDKSKENNEHPKKNGTEFKPTQNRKNDNDFEK